ncbi:hypothetical protein MPTK1_7g19470 [Marchantia polymorpha subsp. ruderalis]|uniref:Uncharacterized protein n=2 Tax=Marchantia polymorpha TaxID=3197 RepID=A0AAF6C1G2_MARPO|nr:hypothetical protein MARPO_0067s0031 [Marchantia polymorpha]BBN18096.1 hypothetical protein Mp_7g19470 [Marchantia polymorpha subsp. ruderalis]|eukprot:PTQ35938.1 hypothetical protein MARPO_0067s0031 [Marchantia polymorpha]
MMAARTSFRARGACCNTRGWRSFRVLTTLPNVHCGTFAKHASSRRRMPENRNELLGNDVIFRFSESMTKSFITSRRSRSDSLIRRNRNSASYSH